MKFTVTTKRTSFFIPGKPVTTEHELIDDLLVVKHLDTGNDGHVFVRGDSIDMSIYDRNIRIGPHKTLSPVPLNAEGEIKMNDIGLIYSTEITVKTYGRERG